MLMWKTLLQKNKLTHCFAVRKFVSATIPSRDVQKPQPSKVPSKDSHNPKEKTIGEKLKETMKVYGVTATLFHCNAFHCIQFGGQLYRLIGQIQDLLAPIGATACLEATFSGKKAEVARCNLSID